MRFSVQFGMDAECVSVHNLGQMLCLLQCSVWELCCVFFVVQFGTDAVGIFSVQFGIDAECVSVLSLGIMLCVFQSTV